MKFFKNIVIVVFCVYSSLNLTAQKNNSKKLIGKWSWVETSGGFGGGIVNPKTEGYTIQMEFTKKGIFKSYKDNVFNLEMKYKVILAKSIYSAEKKHIIHYVGENGQNNGMIDDYFELKGKDTLVLKQECPDCYTKIYVRKK